MLQRLCIICPLHKSARDYIGDTLTFHPCSGATKPGEGNPPYSGQIQHIISGLKTEPCHTHKTKITFCVGFQFNTKIPTHSIYIYNTTNVYHTQINNYLHIKYGHKYIFFSKAINK